ncbi:DNA-directed RNA polymerase subunit omega [Myxosarcina sp. GI1]|uniref:DNA-directed RNA polymerase subunit omega n=1 Tax=Myxosarcina sp. GI1 TaxID=1541065 RepID=UPI0009077048|nr:DNA-directed RNA polymerase subunit omega [Myxosarcina sp. GI1]
MKTSDTSQVMFCTDELMNAASNRYRIVVQVANRAKRRRYEDMDNYQNESVQKPVNRAIVEMSDELTQSEIIGENEDFSPRTY